MGAAWSWWSNSDGEPMRVSCLALVAWLMLGAVAQGQDLVLRTDPEKVRGAEACGECHASAYEVWKGTPHATGFRTLHRLESAEGIAERMGLKLIKRDSLCLDCHYTAEERDQELRAISGVSCESCHGAGRDWIEVHNDYGGRGIDHKSESPEHRSQRIAASRAAGMRRGSDLYAVASSCFGCHTVPREELVNVGRHSLGSADFELAVWTAGEIRHNFLASFLDGDGSQNAVRPIEHRRRVYVLGRALALEHSLRGVAAASGEGVYLKAMQGRLRRALSDLRLLDRLADLPEITAMLTTARSVRASLGQRQTLLDAADRVGEASRAFLDRHDGTRLAGLDPLVEGREDEIAELLADEEDDADPAAASALLVDSAGETTGKATGGPGGAADDPGGNASTAASSTGSPGGGTPNRSATTGGVAAEGEKRSHLRPRTDHDTLTATACQKCHGDQHAWWYGDPHYASIDPFLDQAAEPVKIARLYGLSPSRLTQGDTLCMDCHGTVATARAAREVQDGVSCQSCHGPAADYLEPHQEGDKTLGRQRPGFQKALGLGMVDLRTVEGRLRNCASCHYVTDPRLISAGHPTGADFEIAQRLPAIRHWEQDVEPAAELRTVWGKVLAERGPVPQVRRARLADPGANPGGGAVAGGRGSAGGHGSAGGRATTTPTPPPRRGFVPRPAPLARGGTAGGAATTDNGSGTTGHLPPFPELGTDTPIEDLLLFLRQRLELLYHLAPPPARPAPRRRAIDDPTPATPSGAGATTP